MYFVAIEDQMFENFDDWITNATRRLTKHREYFDAEHKAEKGWVAPHFTALCFDQKGRRCRVGSDFMRARDENSFPVWYIWPDQIAGLIMRPKL